MGGFFSRKVSKPKPFRPKYAGLVKYRKDPPIESEMESYREKTTEDKTTCTDRHSLIQENNECDFDSDRESRGYHSFSSRTSSDSSHRTTISEMYLERLMKPQIAALDLQEDLVLKYFSRFPREVLLQRDIEDWIMIFLENKFAELEDDPTQNLSENLLDNIGFVVPSKAVETMMLRSTQFGFQNHVHPIDTVKRFVLDEFRYNTALSHECPLQHMMKECKVEIIEISCVIEKEGNESILEKSALVNKIQNEIAVLRQSYQVLFHGTDVESAYDISLGGIAVSMGSQKRDFSDGKGFYLTDNYERAKNWAFTITRKPAILIYKIPKPSIEETKKLNLFEEQTSMLKWEAIVPANRSGILEWKMRKMLQQYQCIEGPVSIAETNNSGISGGLTMSRRKLRNSYQLCIIDEDFAGEISQCLSHVVLYNVLGEQYLFFYEPKEPQSRPSQHDKDYKRSLWRLAITKSKSSP